MKAETKAETGRSIRLYKFGDFLLDLERNLLRHRGEVVPLTYKAFQTLAVLVENDNRTVEKDEIIARVWQNTFVEDGSLTRNISTLRKALGEEPGSNKYIETVPRRGYRFVAAVEAIAAETPENMLSGVDSPPIISLEENLDPDLSQGNAQPDDPQSFRLAGAAAMPTQTDVHPNPQLKLTSKIKSSKINLLVFLIFSAAVAASAFFVALKWFKPAADLAAARGASKELSVTKFTNIGKAADAAISPDGRYVVYVSDDGGKQSLSVKQVATGSAVEIVEPAEVSYQGLAFSTDNQFVYFNAWDRKGVGAIYRIPTLGGVSVKIINDCMPNVAISPGNSKIAFIRGYAAQNMLALMIANTDGSAEQIVSQHAQGWLAFPAWSPDGNKIAFTKGIFPPRSPSYTSLREFSLVSNQEREITTKHWLRSGGLVWLKDENLIFSGTDGKEQGLQLWKINSASGAAQKMTNDVNGYSGGLSVTADSNSIVTVQTDAYLNVWTAPTAELSKFNKITAGRYEGMGLGWTPDNRIVYDSWSGGNLDTWLMNQDGSNKRQLTHDQEPQDLPSISGDGASILFTSNRTGTPQIWRMDINGKNQQQLTDGDGAWGPVAAPIGNWFIYISTATDRNLRNQAAEGKGILWKMPLDGGEAVQVTNLYSYNPAVSPDGKMLAYSFWNENARPERFEHEIISLETRQKIRSFELPSTALRSNGYTPLRWMPDGSGLTFVDSRDGASNIMLLPLDGGQPERLTSFNDSQIFWFDWSRDGRQLAITRGVLMNDVVLIKNNL